MLIHRRATPSIEFAGTHLYTWEKRGTVRVKCRPKTEHNVPVWVRTRDARSGGEQSQNPEFRLGITALFGRKCDYEKMDIPERQLLSVTGFQALLPWS